VGANSGSGAAPGIGSRVVALATTPEAQPLDEDYGPLSAALRARGFEVEAPDWEDAAVDWSRFAIVLPRATWNYVDRRPEFLQWAERVGRATRLENDPGTLRWNTDKRYLLDLDRAGIPVIPTVVTPAGEHWQPPAAAEYVVKPAVGAGSRGARRFRADESAQARDHAERLQREGATVITQPYLASVDTAGETALIWIAGRYSHAIRKAAILEREGAAGGLFEPGHVAGLFAPERITPREPGADELAVADRVLQAVAARIGRAPLYARVDLIRDADGAPRVLELEMTEPSLFFRHAAGSADRLAAAIAAAVAPGAG
jgi:O-ureido-D-serine cyclo-ligase